DGAISCELDSRKIGHSSGPLELNKPLVTGWADWQLVVDRILPHAEQWMDFTPAKNDGANQLPDGVRVRVEQNGESFEQWISGSWWRTWSGLTFKMSQASWNPENLGQSTIQILRDPGWLLKWIGSLLVVTGVFLLFYVKKFRRQYATAKTKRIIAPSPAPEAREVAVS